MTVPDSLFTWINTQFFSFLWNYIYLSHRYFYKYIWSILIINMQITIWVSSISFHAYADITFESKSDVSINFLSLG